MLKAGTIILLVMLIYAGLYSILLLFIPGDGELSGSIIGGNITDDNCRQLYENVSRHKAAFALSTVIACFFMLYAGFRKGKKWAWFGLLLGGGLAWGWGVVNTIVFGTTINMIMHLVGMGLLLGGLLLPINIFFTGESKASS